MSATHLTTAWSGRELDQTYAENATEHLETRLEDADALKYLVNLDTFEQYQKKQTTIGEKRGYAHGFVVAYPANNVAVKRAIRDTLDAYDRLAKADSHVKNIDTQFCKYAVTEPDQ